AGVSIGLLPSFSTIVDTVGGNTLTLPITLNLHVQVEVDAGVDNLTGVLSGDGGLFKAGAGTLGLVSNNLASNTYNRDTQALDGKLVLGKFGAAGPVVAVPGNLFVGNFIGAANSAVVRLLAPDQIADTASVEVDSDGFFDLFDNSDTVGTLGMVGGLVDTGTGTLTLQGDLTATSDATVSVAMVQGHLALGAGAGSFTVNDGPGGNDLVMAAVISEVNPGASLTKLGAGQMILSSTGSSYTGGTSVNDG